MTQIIQIFPGVLVETQRGIRCIVKRLETPTKVAIRNLVTNEDEIVELSSLRPIDQIPLSNSRNLDSIDEHDFNIAYEKYLAISRLIDLNTHSVKDIDLVATQAQVNRSTVYRWIADFKQGELVTNLLRKRRSDNGIAKISVDAEKLIGQVLAEFWLNTQRRSMRNAYRELGRFCRADNIAVPSYNTFRARIDKLDQGLAATKRGGAKAAQRFRLTEGTVPNVDCPYSVIQIDHTFLDVMLVDEEHRVAIGRPWITVAIDVFSRMIAGYYVSFDPPGTLGTGICIANAILPKASFLAKLGLDVSYPCMGKPRVIHVDNAKEFRGETLSKACNNLGINLIFRKLKTPNYGGHIERLMGTLATEIHALPGATFADHDQRVVYDSQKKAAMTLNEFEKWLATLIAGAYHYKEHSALKKSPLQRYTEGLLGSDTEIGSGQIALVMDEESLRVSLLPIIERTIQHYGVSIDGIHYYADVLRRWVGSADLDSKKVKRKFLFRRDPRDISFLLFYDPDTEKYFKIPYRDTNRPPISLWELRATLRYLAEQGKKNVDEVQIFRAYDEMRRIEEQSKTTTRKTRLAQTRRKHHEKFREKSKSDESALVESSPVQDPSVNIEPYDEIERY
jgi:putative transposase